MIDTERREIAGTVPVESIIVSAILMLKLFIYLFYLLTDFYYTPFHDNTTKASAVKVIWDLFI